MASVKVEPALWPNAQGGLQHRGDVVAETKPLVPHHAFLAALLKI
jgi:hypothetical protein